MKSIFLEDSIFTLSGLLKLVPIDTSLISIFLFIEPLVYSHQFLYHTVSSLLFFTLIY